MEHASGPGTALCLRLHAGYLCQHAGACCTAGWAIPIEKRPYEQVRVHFGGQAHRRLFADEGPLPQGAAAVLGVQPGGACVFFEPGRGNLCAVHRELGVTSLPSACRHFPRLVLHDARGTLVSLSHFCPTAAGLLRSPNTQAFAIVRAPDPLTLADDGAGDGSDVSDRLEGLDARAALPPLLRPGMLTDLEGYDAWERAAIALLARKDLTAGHALAMLTTATRAAQSWRPGCGSLRETVEREFEIASTRKPDKNLDASGRDELRVRLAFGSVPLGLKCPSPVEDWLARWHRVPIATWWDEVDDAVRGYLAARLFGNWIAYHGQGLHTIVEYLQVALAVLKMEAVRHHAQESPTSPWQTAKEAVRNADLLLVHLADTRTLARLLDQNPLE
jgi:Fe-S-cluster containining protein